MNKQYCKNCIRKDSCPDPSTTEENDYACYREENEQEF